MKRAKKSKEKIGNTALSYCARSLVIGIFAATSVFDLLIMERARGEQ